uniref:Uncharacterized protein n=1 Tax=Macrostomum lignano TaxID=282301 RepID=A0A1I8FQE0_9PLAT
ADRLHLGPAHGVERAIILPTLWLYFYNKIRHVSRCALLWRHPGAFTSRLCVCTPLFGWLSQRNYPGLIFLGMFAAASGPAPATSVRRRGQSDHQKERTGVIVYLLLARQFGTYRRPGSDPPDAPASTRVKKFVIDVYNSPGLFMALLWAVHTPLPIIHSIYRPSVTVDLLAQWPTTKVASSTELHRHQQKPSRSACLRRAARARRLSVAEEAEPQAAAAAAAKKAASKDQPSSLQHMDKMKPLSLKLTHRRMLFVTFSSYFNMDMALEAVLPQRA